MATIGRRRVQIPSVGDVLVLDQPWTFPLHHEHRNITLLAHYLDFSQGIPRMTAAEFTTVTLPAGVELRVSRIYIRNGHGEYDSLTFFAKGLKKRTQPSLPPLPPKPVFKWDREHPPPPVIGGWSPFTVVNQQGKHDALEAAARADRLRWEAERIVARMAWMETPEYIAYTDAVELRRASEVLRKPIRFWAKLEDVNRMVVRSEGWTAREAVRPGTRLIDVSSDDEA